ncbi:MAG: hydrogenase expression/formation protein HypC [Solirubrobacteraceae bacterium]|jgi:hydrogenase maturation factor|nr:hydrogenase expression/formation protein HypC [Solirubrobacteraceae bacterium]
MSNPVSSCDPRELGSPADVSHCITCSDEAVPMTVVAVDNTRGLALCEDEAGARSSVEIALIDPVAPGDTVLVHAGTALA